MAGKKTPKKGAKAKQVLAPVPETEPEFEELTKEDVKKAKQQKATVEAAAEEVVEKVVKQVAKKKGPLTMEDLREAASASAKATVEQLMPAIASAIMQANVPRVAGAVAVVPGQRAPLRTCYLCGLNEKVCGGVEENHVKMVVGPQRYPEFGKWFRGAGINGVWFRSDHPKHKIIVPKAAIGSILAQVEAFEEDERQTNQRRSAEHNSGGFADPEFGGTKTRPATERSGWR